MFILGGFGKSEGGVLFDPTLDIDNVQAELWIATAGVGRTFAIAGRQGKVLAVVPVATPNGRGLMPNPIGDNHE
jgi:ABC-type uncharacterized transport system ATPase subunit